MAASASAPRVLHGAHVVLGIGRARAVNGTISYMPALFGIMMAGYIVERLLAE